MHNPKTITQVTFAEKRKRRGNVGAGKAEFWSQEDWQIDRRSFMPLLGGGAVYLMLAGKALAQQVRLAG